jgi:hypothetical protein
MTIRSSIAYSARIQSTRFIPYRANMLFDFHLILGTIFLGFRATWTRAPERFHAKLFGGVEPGSVCFPPSVELRVPLDRKGEMTPLDASTRVKALKQR